jgi:hypothetical protein
MYEIVLTAHSWVRWAVVLLGIVASLRAITGWSQRKPWTGADDNVGLSFAVAVDIQVLLGLLLYFVYSPYTALAMDDFGNAMRSPDLRFWAVEHGFGALVGVALLHVGRARVRKAANPLRKHRTAAIFFSLALIAILAAVPWPGTPHARPLIPR